MICGFASDPVWREIKEDFYVSDAVRLLVFYAEIVKFIFRHGLGKVETLEQFTAHIDQHFILIMGLHSFCERCHAQIIRKLYDMV